MATTDSTEERGMMRLVVRWLVNRYYPRINISNAERIPRTGPVLLCANHGNSLVDPVLIGIAAVRPVRFMAKAPLFDLPVMGRAMYALGMIPAFRGSDDARQVRKNFESLEAAAKVLVDGQAMGIFPEGKSTDQAHVEMIRSGAARMALQAVEDGAKGLKIVPIGVNYESKAESRSSAWINVGEPIDVDAVLEENGGDVKKARRGISTELEKQLKDVVVHLDEPKWEPILGDLETLVPMPPELAKLSASALLLRKRIADAMNHFLATDQPRAEAIAEDVSAYRDQVEAAGLHIGSEVLRLRGFAVASKLLWNFLLLLRFLVPAIIGTLHHIVPFVLVRGIASRLDQPGLKTVSTHRLMVGLPIYVAWYAVVAFWMHGYFAPWFTWTWMLFAPVAGVISLAFWRGAEKSIVLLWHQIQMTWRREKLKQLRDQKAQLCQRLTELAIEYAEIAPRPVPETRPSRRRLIGAIAGIVLAVLLLGSIAWVGKYWVFDQPIVGRGLDLANLSEAKLDAALDSDEKSLLPIIDGLDKLEAAAIELQKEFADGSRSYTKQADNDAVRELMRRFITYRQALLRTIWKYQNYTDVSDDRQQLRTFLLDFTAASVLYEASMKFVYGFEWRREALAKLNEREPNWGIPPGLYDTIRANLASPNNVRMFTFAAQYYHDGGVQESFARNQLAQSDTYAQFHKSIARAESTIDKLHKSLGRRIAKTAITDAEKLIKNVQYETQSAVSTWIGDFKIREPRDGDSLIDTAQLERLRSLLKPGDVLLERRNWYLSNAFLPGYWPHGAVYVGTAEDLKKRGLDQNEYVKQHLDRYAAKDHEGHAHVIIEAVSEGVVFSSLEHSIGGADSVAVLRPNVSDEEKNEAIAQAFSFADRPYDFEFDFSTTDELVCTEVVYRAYGGNSGRIKFRVVDIMGRPTMPAIKLVEKFRDEDASGTGQFEFIAFIDGDEATGTSHFTSNKQAFINTLNRSGSTFLQDHGRYGIKSIGPLGYVLLSLTVLALIGGIAMKAVVMRRAAKN